MRSRSNVKSALAYLAPAAALALVFAPAAYAQNDPDEPLQGWPRVIDDDRGSIVIYQPQPDTFEGGVLEARAAVSVTLAGEAEPYFGTVWISSRLDTDRDTREAWVADVEVTRVGFPNAAEEHQTALADLLEAEIPTWNLTLSLDRLLTSLDLAETRRRAAENLNMDPPHIIVAFDPAVLVTIDGEPRLQQVEGSNLMRVINTAFNIVLDRDSRTYYLYSGEEQWYAATAVEGPWELTDRVPSQVSQLATQVPEDAVPPEEESEEEEEVGPPPRLVVATEPTELIVINGQPEFTPVTETDLMYVANTDSDVLMDLETARYYVVLSGRWFASESWDGPWSNVPGDALPADFAAIPFESEVGHLLVSVSGTDQANEAVLDNQIPQTSAISRTEATAAVEYDGEPQFDPIEETELQYGVNTPQQVIKVGDAYYLCDEAVWFVSNSPTGPWAVADAVPPEIYEIPPSSPVHNVTYVYVYDTTPDVVYVGYYPGYTGSYVYGGTIVYGTGYWYRPWYGRYYYPRHATWGFHVRWNPWTGWGFGFSYGWGPFRFSIGFGGWWRGGWWGPARYRGFRRGYHRGWNRGFAAGYRAGSRAAHRNNIYRRQNNMARNVDRTRPAQGQQRARVADNRQNNVFSDRDGNVFRRDNDGSWQERGRDGWQNNSGVSREAAQERTAQAQQRDRLSGSEGLQRPQTQQQQRPQAQQQRPTTQQQRPQAQQQRPQTGSFQRPSTGSSLERSNNSRQRGTTRTNNFNRSRSAGASRAGGRRRP